MAVRACAYKGCDNYVIDGVHSGSFTLFQFPKDPDRRKLWMKFGHVATNLPANALLMCSDHFDKKFMSVNQRRRVLLGAAIPFPYEKPNEVSEKDALEEGTYIVIDTGIGDDEQQEQQHDVLGELEETEHFQVESTMKDEVNETLLRLSTEDISVDNSYEECLTNSDTIKISNDYDTDKVIFISSNKNNSTFKRKLMESKLAQWKEKNAQRKNQLTSTYSESEPAVKKCATTSLVRKADGASKISQSTDEQCDKNLLVDPKHVTTFIFKGEEYVQMALEHYRGEKTELMQKILHYESIIKNIKKSVDDVNLD